MWAPLRRVDVGVVVVDEANRVVGANDRFQEITLNANLPIVGAETLLLSGLGGSHPVPATDVFAEVDVKGLKDVYVFLLENEEFSVDVNKTTLVRLSALNDRRMQGKRDAYYALLADSGAIRSSGVGPDTGLCPSGSWVLVWANFLLPFSRTSGAVRTFLTVRPATLTECQELDRRLQSLVDK